jgi:hypothetical protein
MNIKMLKAAFAGMVLSVSGFATAGLLTFEEFGQKECCWNGDILDNEYSALGINFSGNWEIKNQSGGFGVNAISGEHFAAFNQVRGDTELTITFDNTTDLLSGFLGTSTTGAWSFNAYLNDSLVISSDITSSANQYKEFSFSGVDFNKVILTSQFRAGVLDNLQFGKSIPSQVPEPSTLAIFALGIMGLASRRFKKQ